ncbi:hypothetical protein AVEN_237047-1 [Araneus ventricosus]|uniref:Uncharacterized protein n=1 Tax=Araneus ventricosus TaxID=182803 RepID=A0A4Y2M0H7_ARAVE|nr:hypothetical protein AVEN_237047-1 [Araneus ventricosus]
MFCRLLCLPSVPSRVQEKGKREPPISVIGGDIIATTILAISSPLKPKSRLEPERLVATICFDFFAILCYPFFNIQNLIDHLDSFTSNQLG